MEKPLKSAGDVEWLKINPFADIGGSQILEDRFYGKIKLGRLKFRGNRPIQVAIKVFHQPLTDSQAFEYQRNLRRLREAKLPVLVSGMVKHEGTWVQVMRLYSKGTDIYTGKKESKLWDLKTAATRFVPARAKEFIDIWCKMLNRGMMPAWDSTFFVGLKPDAKIVIGDIDTLTSRLYGNEWKKITLPEKLQEMSNNLRDLGIGDLQAHREMVEYALQKLNPAVRKKLIGYMRNHQPMILPRTVFKSE